MEPGEPTPRRRFRLPRSLRDLTGRELDEEVRFHLEMRAARLEAEGLSPDEARREARRRFGSVEDLRREAAKRERTIRLRESAGDLARDLRFALRGLAKSPLYAGAAIVTLALAIGATTAIYSVVRPVLFEPLPYPDPDRIVMVWESDGAGGRTNVGFATVEDVAARARTLESVAATGLWLPVLSGDGTAERVQGLKASASYFPTLGVVPAIGRGFRPEDDRPEAERVVILAHDLWATRLGADPDAVGGTISLGGTAVPVVGVMPEGFVDPLYPETRIWTPLRYDASLGQACRTCRHLRAVARLAPGATLDGAERELAGLAATLRSEHPTEYPEVAREVAGAGLFPVRLRDDMTREVRPALLAVLVAVALVLLIACANLSHLLIARGGQRRDELAIRSALGESRARVLRSLLVDSLVLAALGGLAGIGVALAGVELLVEVAPPGVPRIENVAVDGGALLFALGLTAAVGLVFGLLPALRVLRERSWEHGGRLASGRGTVGGRLRQRSLLVAAEVALTLVLLVGAGLLLRSLVGLLSVSPGFDPEGVLTLQVQASGARYETDADVHALFDRVLEEVRTLPGVEAAALTSQLPLSEDFDGYGVHFRSRPRANPEDDPSAHRYAVSPGYLEAMDIRLLRGRALDAGDAAGRPHVALINRSLARCELGGADPIGQQIRIGGAADGPWWTIVGVVDDVRQVSLAAESDAVYLPAAQWQWADFLHTLVIRTGGDPEDLVAAVRDRVRAIDPGVPVTRVATLDELRIATTARTRFALLLFQLFAGVAVVLCAIGIFGVLAGTVAERRREIGVRSALGARRASILALVVRQGMRPAAIGALAGLAASVVIGRFLESLLFGISSLDPATYGGVTMVIATVALAACWLPARRAARLDPVTVLRSE